MKKLSLNHLSLDKNVLSSKEKKEITGGYFDDCLIRCWCAHLGEPEKIVPRSQCNGGREGHLCFESYGCVDKPLLEL